MTRRQKKKAVMIPTGRQLIVVIHGMVLGAIFLLSFAGGLAELINLRPDWSTESGAGIFTVQVLA